MKYSSIVKLLENEWLFFLSAVGLLSSSIFLHRLPNYSTDDFKVVFSLFVLLIIIKGLEESNFLRFLASSVERGKWVHVKLVGLTYFLSMLITNDVALLAVVPITLAMRVRRKVELVILEALAANAGSALTPFGNPQNMFIYYHYDLHFLQMFETIFPLVAICGVVLLFLAFLFGTSEVLIVRTPSFSKQAYLYLTFFVLFALAVLKLLPLWLGLLPVFCSLFKVRKLLKIDYFLLGTFLAFFGFTDNLHHAFGITMHSSGEVFWYSLILSQLISNVPATLFLADFTHNWKALLWGVNVGGFGDLIGSLATLIAYRFVSKEEEFSWSTLLRFHVYGFFFLVLGIFLFYLKFRW